MNPTELQQRLDAAGRSGETATEADWNRHLELRRARRRHRRAGWIAGAAAAVAAVTVVALNWNPPTNSVEIVPAEPTGFQESDLDARVVDVTEVASAARRCAAVVREDDYTTVFAARSGVADAVTVQLPDGELRFCEDWTDRGVDSATRLDLPTAGMFLSGGDALEDGSELVSVLGFEPFPYDHVVVTDPQGQDHYAVMGEGFWWTPVRVDPGVDREGITWRAYAADGTQIDEEDPSGIG